MKNGRDTFQKYRTILLSLSKLSKALPFRVREKLFDAARNARGKYGIAIRYILLKSIAKNCGDNVSIHEGCFIFNPQNLSIGNNVSIWPMCYLDAYGGISIGNNISIAHTCSILSTNHRLVNNETPIKYQKLTKASVVIEDDVWIGAKVTILSGKTIGCGSVLAAGAVITHDVLPNQVVGGVPAKVIKSRKTVNT